MGICRRVGVPCLQINANDFLREEISKYVSIIASKRNAEHITVSETEVQSLCEEYFGSVGICLSGIRTSAAPNSYREFLESQSKNKQVGRARDWDTFSRAFMGQSESVRLINTMSCMRHLLEKGRAVTTELATTEGFSLIGNMCSRLDSNIFRHILSFLKVIWSRKYLFFFAVTFAVIVIVFSLFHRPYVYVLFFMIIKYHRNPRFATGRIENFLMQI